MKIKLAYLPEEQQEADRSVSVLRRLHPRIKVRKSDAHPPFKHIYLATTKPANPCDSKENP